MEDDILSEEEIKRVREDENIREQVRAAREEGGSNPRQKFNDLTDGENVIKLVREEPGVEL